jgi:hypothetical protein
MGNSEPERLTCRIMAEQIVDMLRIGKLNANNTWNGAEEGEHR